MSTGGLLVSNGADPCACAGGGVCYLTFLSDSYDPANPVGRTRTLTYRAGPSLAWNPTVQQLHTVPAGGDTTPWNPLQPPGIVLGFTSFLDYFGFPAGGFKVTLTKVPVADPTEPTVQLVVTHNGAVWYDTGLLNYAAQTVGPPDPPVDGEPDTKTFYAVFGAPSGWHGDVNAWVQSYYRDQYFDRAYAWSSSSLPAGDHPLREGEHLVFTYTAGSQDPAWGAPWEDHGGHDPYADHQYSILRVNPDSWLTGT